MGNRLLALAVVLGLGVCAGTQAMGLTVEKAFKVGAKTCDVVTWTDAAGKQRRVALVRADGDVGKFTGGYIEQYTYFLGDKQVTGKSDETMSGVSGLGCAVDHHASASTSKSNSTDATTAFITEGASHCIWRFKSQYHGPSQPEVKGRRGKDVAIGLVIDYFIADGRDDVVWSVSYDCSKLKDGEIAWDARGPYVQFDWDGDGKFFGAPISGIRFGDKYRFKTVDYAGEKSSWDYTQPNVVPYMMLYKSGEAGDAELAMVQTTPWTQRGGGGYWWASKNWGKTGTGMMENWNCPFQLNAYEGYGGEKMAWGSPFGTVGVSKFQGLDFATNFSGWPYAGYAVSIVAGRHSDAGGDRMISGLETVQKTKLTANKGTVVMKVPGYAGLEKETECLPAGWDGVYGTWTLACDGGKADITIALSDGALTNPTFCFTGFDARQPTLTLNGKPLTPGTDCFISVDPTAKRLWLTLRGNLQGPTNTLTLR